MLPQAEALTVTQATLLAAMFEEQTFTLNELALLTGLNIRTVRSTVQRFLKRYPALLEKVERERRDSPGQPSVRYCLSGAGETHIGAILEKLNRKVGGRVSTVEVKMPDIPRIRSLDIALETLDEAEREDRPLYVRKRFLGKADYLIDESRHLLEAIRAQVGDTFRHLPVSYAMEACSDRFGRVEDRIESGLKARLQEIGWAMKVIDEDPSEGKWLWSWAGYYFGAGTGSDTAAAANQAPVFMGMAAARANMGTRYGNCVDKLYLEYDNLRSEDRRLASRFFTGIADALDELATLSQDGDDWGDLLKRNLSGLNFASIPARDDTVLDKLMELQPMLTDDAAEMVESLICTHRRDNSDRQPVGGGVSLFGDEPFSRKAIDVGFDLLGARLMAAPAQGFAAGAPVAAGHA